MKEDENEEETEEFSDHNRKKDWKRMMKKKKKKLFLLRFFLHSLTQKKKKKASGLPFIPSKFGSECALAEDRPTVSNFGGQKWLDWISIKLYGERITLLIVLCQAQRNLTMLDDIRDEEFDEPASSLKRSHLMFQHLLAQIGMNPEQLTRRSKGLPPPAPI
ncbi:hypothetical protein GPALN_005709 [Globodera pallida]|nr:hypothetical protein GPALN_005709 [Globodera pallida]